MRPEVIYTGLFHYPEGDAAAANLRAVGKALREAGYDVIYAPAGKEGRPQDLQSDGGYAFEGFRYYPQSELRTERLSPLRRLMRYCSTGSNTLAWLKSRDNSNVKAVILYGGWTSFFTRLHPFCRQLGIPLIPHCVEWFAPEHSTGGRFGLFRWDVELTMRHWNKKAQNVLCISSFLERNFKDQGCATLRLPPLVDLHLPRFEGPVATERAGSFRVIFSGSPDRERWDIILAGFLEARKRGADVCLEILGSKREKWLSLIGPSRPLAEAMGSALFFHGFVPVEAVTPTMAQADAGIIVRDDARWSRACFPMKVPELLAQGVPIICSRVSDLPDHLKDGVNALVLETVSVGRVADCLVRASHLTTEQRCKMRDAAYASATAFDYKTHVDGLRGFIEAAAGAKHR